MITEANLLTDNRNRFRKWLDEKSRGNKPEYKDHLADVLESWLNEKLRDISVGNLFRFESKDVSDFLQMAKKIYEHPSYGGENGIDWKDRHRAPSAAISNYYRYLGFDSNWKKDIYATDPFGIKKAYIEKKFAKEYQKKDVIFMPENAIQTIFFGAPGTGKSYKVNSLLPDESVWTLTGEERKNLFICSEVAKKEHYADVLGDETKFGGDIWNMDELSLLEEKLSEVDSDDNVKNPEHSALQAYIKFLKEYKFEQTVFRTTFHPDYDYAQFVGAYKPKKEGEKITYSFVPQVFAKAYAAAWRLQLSDEANKNVFLVIEEINRGNCAQIFGDIFQLLDRDGDGFSQYSIDADCDFAEWLETDEKGLKFVWDKYKEAVGEGKLKLPPNLNILATMNTSDQSLFPMDSAFKRRFDWEYVPISFDGKEAANYQIDIDGSQYSWQKFVETVNEKILTLTESEDKQLGEFFIKPESGNVISKDRFLGKVMFYLWNEVCKDEHKNGSFFRTKDGDKEKYFTFQDLYRDKGLLKRFIEKLFEEGPSQE